MNQTRNVLVSFAGKKCASLIYEVFRLSASTFIPNWKNYKTVTPEMMHN